MSRAAAAIATKRLRLVPATAELVDAELDDANDLAGRLGAELPPDWPPTYHTSDALQRTLAALAAPGAAGWWLHYFVRVEGERPELIGVGGLKGPPVEGVAEIGYSVVASAQRLGYATEAARALVESAFERGARTARAETLPTLTASIRVLEKLGFASAEPSRPGVIAFALERR